MDPRELRAGDGEHPERIRVPQVVLAGEGKAAQVVERADVSRRDAAEPLPVDGNPLLHAADESAQPFELERPELLAGQALEPGLEDHVSSICRSDAIVTQ